MTSSIDNAWALAKERFAQLGIDAEAAIKQLDSLPISIHCWQGDDVAGFESSQGGLTGGIQATATIRAKRAMPGSYATIWNWLFR
jgi:L-rhamnose isomerase